MQLFLIYYCFFLHVRQQKVNDKKKELQPVGDGRGLKYNQSISKAYHLSKATDCHKLINDNQLTTILLRNLQSVTVLNSLIFFFYGKKYRHTNKVQIYLILGTKYSRMDQAKFVEDSLFVLSLNVIIICNIYNFSNHFVMPQGSSPNLRFSDDFRGNRSYLIRLNSLNNTSEIWRSLRFQKAMFNLRIKFLQIPQFS